MKSSAAEYFKNLSPVKGTTRRDKYDYGSKSGSGRCHCCPYGYHIDLDFVRYCQALNQGSKNDNPSLAELKRKKRARRRQTKSMEAMLGLSAQDSLAKSLGKDQRIFSHSMRQESKFTSYEHRSPVPPRREKKRSTGPPSPPPRKQSLYHPILKSPPPDIINSSSLILSKRSEAASEALQEAVQDFEDLLESSKEHPRRKSRFDDYQPYPAIDLLHNTSSSYSSHQSTYKVGSRMNGSSLARSNSLPRHFLHDSTSLSRLPFHNQKEPIGMSQSYTYSNAGYSNQNPMINDAMAALNAAQGYSENRFQDIDTMSVSSAMSGVSTTTLQSIRDQMATGLSRLKELEEEVKGYPNILIKLDIMKEERRILLEELRNMQRGLEMSPMVPLCIDQDQDLDLSVNELEVRLETLRKFSVDRERSRSDRKRSQSPMRVNLQDFHSYRRARRGSLSEGSDCESPYIYKGREKDDTSLYISEWSDYPSDVSRGTSNQTHFSTPRQTPRRGVRDAGVSCRVITRDVGVSHVPTKTRSLATQTEKSFEDFSKDVEKKKEIRSKPCLQCFKRTQKTFESRSVGTISPKNDSGLLSLSSLSIDSIETEDLESKDDDISLKNPIVHRMGKKSPIINRLSSPQLHPPVLTFDNSTNTEPLRQRDQRINTSLRMENLFTTEQLNELIADAKKQWEATHVSKILLNEKKMKPLTCDRSVQASVDASVIKTKPFAQNVGIMAKPSTKEIGILVDSTGNKTDRLRVKSIACGSNIPFSDIVDKPAVKTKSVAVGDGKLTDNLCPKCESNSRIRHRSVGCGISRITDILCEKCNNLKTRSIGVGDAKVTDEICIKCKSKGNYSVSCQTYIPSRSVGVGVNIQPPVTKENYPTTTPEIERRPFGSSGVRVCDKCHDAITSVAKDMVKVGSPIDSVAVINQSSKIPRLVEYQKIEEKEKTQPIKNEIASGEGILLSKPQTLDLVSKGDINVPNSKYVDDTSPHNTISSKLEKAPFKKEEKSPTKIPKSEAFSSGSSLVSSSHPSISSSPQIKRVPYNRQQTYSKSALQGAGFDNLAFDERGAARQDEQKNVRKSSLEKGPPTKPNRKKALTKTKPSSELSQKDKERRGSLSSSDDEDDDETSSLAGSSIAVTNLSCSVTSMDDVNKQRKKSQPSRGMQAALKVLNDSIGKPVRSGQQLTNALNIIQKEWFKISSLKDADPLDVEEYMDAFEEYSRGVLQRVVNLADTSGNTAMHYAVSHGNFDVVSVLLNSKVCNINQQNKAGYTATMLVALAQIRNVAHESVVNKLFESGDVNIKASQHGQTALMLAVSHGRLDMVRMLIPAGADPNIQDEDGSTALMCAAEHGHLAIVQFLVGQPDTDLYLMDNDGSTALTIAVEAGHKDVGVLLYKQMNISRGSSPYASLRGGKRSRTSSMSRSAMHPPPRSSAPVSPGRSRKSSGRESPANGRPGSSASLSNLIL